MSITEKSLYKDFKPPFSGTASFELKMTKTGSLPFSAVKEHQRRALLQSQERLLIRIPDAVGGIGMQLPFDFVQVANATGYVVICYYIPRKPKILYYIKIRIFLEEESKSNRKSLTEARAKEIATHVHNLVEKKMG